jgi:hypothetical protein
MIGAHFARAACQWLERSPVSMLVKIVVSHSAAWLIVVSKGCI